MKLIDFYAKNSLKEGQLIEFNFEENLIKGTIIPSKLEETILMIKLDSGYNAGFLTTKIKNIKLLGENKKVGKQKLLK